jgi:thiamine biosynthesis lipoprotein
MLGCEVGLFCRAADSAADRAMSVLLDGLDLVDRHCSRFRGDSELSRLNRDPRSRVQVSSVLAEVVRLALDAAAETDGWFDPSHLDQLVAAGYDRDFALLPSRRPGVPIPEAVAGWRDVSCSRDGWVRRPPGLRLDLGGIAKGWAADRTASALEAALPGLDAMIDLGGDIAVTAGAADGPGWDIEAGEAGLSSVVRVTQGAVATSGTTKRRWATTDGWRHHLLDRRGLPASTDVACATVLAPTCAQADVAAKVVVVAGAKAGSMYLNRWGLSAVLWPARPVGRRAIAVHWPAPLTGPGMTTL